MLVPMIHLARAPAAPVVPLRLPPVCCVAPTEPEIDDLETIDDLDVPEPEPSFSPKLMPGIADPLGFFDPVGFSEGASEGRLKFYREVELKHGRIASASSLKACTLFFFAPLPTGAHIARVQCLRRWASRSRSNTTRSSAGRWTCPRTSPSRRRRCRPSGPLPSCPSP